MAPSADATADAQQFVSAKTHSNDEKNEAAESKQEEGPEP
jgi:hypothetical protein